MGILKVLKKIFLNLPSYFFLQVLRFKMQKLLSLTFLLGLTSALAAPTGEKGTAGLTPGEPGQGDHGHGMKGLGGGMVEVLCVPRQVALGQPFIVNVHYLNDIKRPVDIHVCIREHA